MSDYNIGGLDEFDKVLRVLGEEEIPLEMTQLANELAGELLKKVTSLERHPKDTGLLIESWHIAPAKKGADGYESSVYNNTEYAAHVEFGHRIVDKKGKTMGFMKGAHMMDKSLEELNAELPGLLQMWLDDVLSRHNG